MTGSASSFNILAQLKGGNVFEDSQKPRVNACFFMPCTDPGRSIAQSLVALFKTQGYRASLSSAPSTKADLGRYEVNACDVPEALADEAVDFFQDYLNAVAYNAKADPKALGYGSGIHEIQDQRESACDRRGGPR